jgi:regulator of protease activity HflC (stomatin/prohibitin superfamily)
MIRPVGDRMQKVNMQIAAMAVPAQDGITKDNVTVRVDAVVYFRVDPIKATVNVQNYLFAVSQQAQTSLRSIIGQSEMDQLLAERDSVNRELRRIIDVSLPESMKRSMSRQAEAERERRARIITADANTRPPSASPRPPTSWPATPPRCSCGCCRPWSRWPGRRTARWSCRYRWSCCGSSRK